MFWDESLERENGGSSIFILTPLPNTYPLCLNSKVLASGVLNGKRLNLVTVQFDRGRWPTRKRVVIDEESI